jgi:hypothetical protein
MVIWPLGADVHHYVAIILSATNDLLKWKPLVSLGEPVAEELHGRHLRWNTRPASARLTLSIESSYQATQPTSGPDAQ